ncbi:hypothetical protein PMAYCL1PPCAC_08297, partial [Pristionchus mayeri]
IKQEGYIQDADEMLSEFKEEPLDIKNEAIDDFPDLKQEDHIDDVDMRSEFKEEQVDDYAYFMQEEPIAEVYDPFSGTSRPLDESIIGTTEGREPDMYCAEGVEKRSRCCSVCGERTTSWFLTPNYAAKEQHFRRILIDLNPEELGKVENIIKMKVRAPICIRHITGRQVEGTESDSTTKKARLFSYSECGQSFFSKPNLRVHMRIHTGKLHLYSLQQ